MNYFKEVGIGESSLIDYLSYHTTVRTDWYRAVPLFLLLAMCLALIGHSQDFQLLEFARAERTKKANERQRSRLRVLFYE